MHGVGPSRTTIKLGLKVCSRRASLYLWASLCGPLGLYLPMPCSHHLYVGPACTVLASLRCAARPMYTKPGAAHAYTHELFVGSCKGLSTTALRCISTNDSTIAWNR